MAEIKKLLLEADDETVLVDVTEEAEGIDEPIGNDRSGDDEPDEIEPDGHGFE